MSWATIIIIALLPNLIRWGRQWMAPKVNSPAKTPKTHWDIVMNAFLVALLAYFAGQLALNQPTNILSIWDITPETPTGRVRKYFREWMAAQFPGWVEGITLSQSGFDGPQIARIQMFESLFDRLKSVESRRVYQLVGNEAFTKCTWCVEGIDFALFNIPRAIGWYTIAAVFLGIATTSAAKSGWRFYGVMYLALVLAMEAFLVWEELDSISTSEPSSYGITNILIFQLRTACFLVLFGVAWLFDVYGELSLEARLARVFEQERFSMLKLNMARVAHRAILGNASLRGKYVDSVKTNIVHLTPAEREAHKEEIDELTKQSEQSANLLLHVATNQGVVPVSFAQ